MFQRCKCAIPVKSIINKIQILVETGYGFIIYDYNKENKEYKEIYKLEGKYINETITNIECKKCWNKKIKMITKKNI